MPFTLIDPGDDKQPYQPPSTGGFRLIDPGQSEGRRGIFGAGAGGIEQTINSLRTAFNLYTGDTEEALDLATREIDKTPAQDRFMAEIQAGMEEADTTILDGIRNVAKAAWTEPKGAFHEMIAQLPNSAVVLGGMYAGGKTGAVLGTMITPGPGTGVGTVIGTVVGGIIGMFGGNVAIETGFLARDKAADGDLTPEEISEIKRQGIVKGGVITGIDTITIGLSRALLGAPGRAVERSIRKTLADEGVDVVSEAAVKNALSVPSTMEKILTAGSEALSRTMRRGTRTSRGLTAFSAETLSEGTGEYYGSLAAGLEASPTDAVMESLMSMPQSAVELRVAKSLTRKGQLTQVVEDVSGGDIGNQEIIDSIMSSESVEEAVGKAAEITGTGPIEDVIEPTAFEPIIEPADFEPLSQAEIDYEPAIAQKMDQDTLQKELDYDAALMQRAEAQIVDAGRETEKQELFAKYAKENNLPSTLMRDSLLAAFIKQRASDDTIRERQREITQATRYPRKPEQIVDLRQQVAILNREFDEVERDIKTFKKEKGARISLKAKVAEAGGISMREGHSEGLLDKNEMSNGKWIFTRDGMSFDAMAEKMAEIGYQFTDELGNIDKTQFMEAFDNSIRGLHEAPAPGMEELVGLQTELEYIEESIAHSESALSYELENYNEFSEGKIPIADQAIADAAEGTPQEKAIADSMVNAINSGLSLADAQELLDSYADDNNDYGVYAEFRSIEHDQTTTQSSKERQAVQPPGGVEPSAPVEEKVQPQQALEL